MSTQGNEQAFSVPGASCGHCSAAISDEVGKVEGVTAVEVDLDTKLVTVSGHADQQAVVAAIDEAGYDAAPVAEPKTA